MREKELERKINLETKRFLRKHLQKENKLKDRVELVLKERKKTEKETVREI